MKNSIWKKILSLLIVLTLLPVGTAVCASDVYTQEDIKAFHDNVSLLYAFDLIEDDNHEMATTVSRGEFASIIMKYLQFGSGIAFSEADKEKTFSDVYENSEDIYGIVSMGIMSGYPNGKFAPENNIVFEEAIKTIITALGWDKIAGMRGGYPGGYISIAAGLELTEGVHRGQGSILTYFDLVQILVNALSAELYVDETSDTEVTPQSWLSSRLKADKQRGTITSFDNETGIIVIDDAVYNSENDYTDMLGCRVDFYTDHDDNVLHICDISRERVEFDAFLIDDYSEKTYSVYKDEITSKTQQYELSQDAYIIYNGVLADNLSINDMIPEYGKVTFINNNGDDLYESVLIESYKIYSVISVDSNNEKIVCKDSEGKTEVVDVSTVGKDSVVLVNSSGKPIEFDDIPSEAVLRVGFSADRKNAKIIVSEKTVNGSIVSMENIDDYICINIDGVEYRTVSNFADSAKIKVGIIGEFYLDSENLIAGVKLQKTGWQYGYLMNAYFDSTGEEILYVKIFDNSEEAVVFECMKKIKIDGLSGKKATEVEKLLKDGNSTVKKQMIRYKLNGEGLIKEIDTPYNSVDNIDATPKNGESTDSLRLVFAKTNAHYSKALYSFEGKINVLRTTPIFSIPGDDVGKFHVRTVSVLTNDKRYNIEAYSDSENSNEPCFLYMKTSLGATGDDTVGLVSEVVTAIDSEDEVLTKFSVETYSGHMELYYEYDEDETPVELDEGDIISFKYDEDYADSIRILYKYKTKTLPNGNTSGSFGTSQLHYMFGSVYSKGNDSITITSADVMNGEVPSSGQLESVYTPIFKIFKCSAANTGRKPIITEGTADDIIDYKNGRENCSKVFMATDWQWPRIIVIYQGVSN